MVPLFGTPWTRDFCQKCLLERPKNRSFWPSFPRYEGLPAILALQDGVDKCHPPGPDQPQSPHTWVSRSWKLTFWDLAIFSKSLEWPSIMTTQTVGPSPKDPYPIRSGHDRLTITILFWGPTLSWVDKNHKCFPPPMWTPRTLIRSKIDIKNLSWSRPEGSINDIIGPSCTIWTLNNPRVSFWSPHMRL